MVELILADVQPVVVSAWQTFFKDTPNVNELRFRAWEQALGMCRPIFVRDR